MYKKALMAIVALAMISMTFAPAFAWEYPDGTQDHKVEFWGPHADQLLIKMYASEISEWNTGIGNDEIDITDSPLDSAHFNAYNTDPTLAIYGYGAEFGTVGFELNNNNNTYLGNPPDPAYPNPRYPNPMGYTVSQSGDLYDNGFPLRHAIAHLVNRDAVVGFVGAETAIAQYTPVVESYGKYVNRDILPGGTLEELTHPYDPAVATAILGASGMFPIGTDGWRYWDRNRNGVYDGGTEYLEIKLLGRLVPVMIFMAQLLHDALEISGKIHVDLELLVAAGITTQWNLNKDAHICAVRYNLGSTPETSLLSFDWNYYWHPGRPYNSAGCNKDAFNAAADGVQYANTQDDAVYWSRIAQEVFCESALSVVVYSATGFKVVQKNYVGPEPGLTGQPWYGWVNWLGYGVDNFYTFLNLHPSCQKFDGTIRYGFKTVDLRQMNPIYTEWLWDNTIIDLIGYESLVGRNPYTLDYIPWVCKTFQVSTYNHPIYGTCTKVIFTLRNDVYFQDGTQLTIADIFFTFVEIDDLLAAGGRPPPWWISNVQNILAFKILDPLNFQVLLDVKSMFAIGWIGGNRILPKHIWKPIVTGAIAPKSGMAWNPMTFAPDPNLIGSGPWRLDEYVQNSHLLLVRNYASRSVDTGIVCLDPNADSVPIHNPVGYFRLKPKYVDIHADNYRAKIFPTESIPPCNPRKWMWVNLTATDHNLWLEEFEFEFPLPIEAPPIGKTITLMWPQPMLCQWQVVDWIDGNLPEYPPNGVLSVCDMIKIVPVSPPGPPSAYIWVHIEKPALFTTGWHVGQAIEAIKTVTVDGNVIAGPEPEFEKPCIPIVETFTVNLSKCLHTITLVKDITTQWFLTPENTLVPNPYMGPMTVTWPIWVTLREDVVGSYYINTQLSAPDCKVDLKDVYANGKSFGSVPGDAKWNTVADINDDYKIDLKDYFAICKKFGKW